MRVRLATVEDADRLAEALAAVAAEEGAWLAAEAPVDRAAAGLRFHTATVSASHALWVLEEDDDRLAGCAGLHPTPADGVGCLGMFVTVPARGRGGGRALVAAVLAHAGREGLHKLELEVWVENARAIAFYSRAGFAVEGVRRDHYRRGDGSLRSVLIMARAP